MPAPDDPLSLLEDLISQATALGIKNPGAVVVSTVDAAGQPSSRQVLLKGLDQRGLVFYTNLESRKAIEIADNPRVSLNFYWREIGWQAIVLGVAEPVADEEADAYFASRDRGSQIGAWASRQSRPLLSRETLEREAAEVEGRFGDGEVPRPPFWSGFRVVAHRIELWHEREHRLHDRTVFELEEAGWRSYRVYP